MLRFIGIVVVVALVVYATVTLVAGHTPFVIHVTVQNETVGAVQSFKKKMDGHNQKIKEAFDDLAEMTK